jgi:dolichyl-phosphate-mannose-protein mannosyltransferase
VSTHAAAQRESTTVRTVTVPRAGNRTVAIGVLAAGALLRLALAYVVFPGQGLSTDLGLFSGWATTLARVGPGDFYASAASANYPPGYLYLLWLVGALASPVAGLLGTTAAHATLLLLKLPAIGADLLIALLLYRAGRSWWGARVGIVAAALYLFVPVTWYDSALWGQVDAVGTLVMLAALLVLVAGWSEAAAALAALAVLVKPQDAVVLVVVLPILVRRHLLRPGSGPTPALGRRLSALDGRLGGILRDQGWRRLATSAVAASATVILPLVPFDIEKFAPASLAGVPILGDLAGLIGLFLSTGSQYAVLTANAFNGWALVGSQPLAAVIGASSGSWTGDSVTMIAGLPAVAVGVALLCAVGLLVSGGLLVRDGRVVILLGFCVAAFAFYALPTRVHERYLFPFFGPAALLAAGAGARALGYAAVGVLNAVNIHAVLGAPLDIGRSFGMGNRGGGGFAGGNGGGLGFGPGNPGGGAGNPGFGGFGNGASSISLPFTDIFRSEVVVTAVAIGQTAALLALVVAFVVVVVRGVPEPAQRVSLPHEAAAGA